VSNTGSGLLIPMGAVYDMYVNLIIGTYYSLQALRKNGINFTVAPFEADAQLASYAISGKVYAVISEDSGMMAYGCPRVRCF
jgi:hypothetical protein